MSVCWRERSPHRLNQHDHGIDRFAAAELESCATPAAAVPAWKSFGGPNEDCAARRLPALLQMGLTEVGSQRCERNGSTLRERGLLRRLLGRQPPHRMHHRGFTLRWDSNGEAIRVAAIGARQTLDVEWEGE